MSERDEYDESECWQCSGEGFVYGCSWDWQCDTWDEGEGTCLCTRRCDRASILSQGVSEITQALIIVGVLIAPPIVYLVGYGLGRFHRFLSGRGVPRSQADYHAGA